MSDQALPHDTMPNAPSSMNWLMMIVTLIIFSAFEIWVGWTTSLPDSADRFNLHGALIVARIFGQLLLGSAALASVLFGRARYAIILLAANMLLGWFSDLSDPANWRITSLWSAQETIWNLVVLPAGAFAAARYAAKNTRLGLATFLICLPTLYIVAIMIPFVIGVIIYGF